MILVSRSLGAFLVLTLLVSCGTQSATDPATRASPAVLGTEDINQAAKTFNEPPTLYPSRTPNATETVFAQARAATQFAEQTLIAPYPRICTDPFTQREFSPDGLWLTELCPSEADDSLILTVSNRATQSLWKLVYRDYTQRAGTFWDEGFQVVNWSNDDRYVYIRVFFFGDGGVCFTHMHPEQHGKGLLRLDLQTGSVTTMLPLKDQGGYNFSFSPTGRRLVYRTYPPGLRILDLQTGQLIDVNPASQFDVGGNYVWSPDGLQFVYFNVAYTDQWDIANYSLRLVNGKTGEEQIVLESAQNCFAVKDWKDDHVIVVERFDPDDKVAVIEYDLNLKQVLSERTATPAP
jgi:hypothetical protein